MKTYITRPDGKKEFVADIIKRCQENATGYGPQIRRLARHQKLIAQKSRRDGKWYFADVFWFSLKWKNAEVELAG